MIETVVVAKQDGGLRASQPTTYPQPHWYCVYTCAHHESRVASRLDNNGVECFLPEYESLRRWKDRKVRIRLPLFPGYLFVRLALEGCLKVLQTPGVARLVGFGGRPTPVPDQEITAVREILKQGRDVAPYPYLRVGERVRVIRGPLEGVEGTIMRRKNRSRFVISLHAIERSIAAEVGELELEPVPPASFQRARLSIYG